MSGRPENQVRVDVHLNKQLSLLKLKPNKNTGEQNGVSLGVNLNGSKKLFKSLFKKKGSNKSKNEIVEPNQSFFYNPNVDNNAQHHFQAPVVHPTHNIYPHAPIEQQFHQQPNNFHSGNPMLSPMIQNVPVFVQQSNFSPMVPVFDQHQVTGWDPRVLRIGIGWNNCMRCNIDMDVGVLFLNNDFMEDFLFYNNRKNNYAVLYADDQTGNNSKDGDDEVIDISMKSVPIHINRLLVVVQISNAAQKCCQTFGSISNPFIHMVEYDTGVEVTRIQLSQSLPRKSACFAIELTRTGTHWTSNDLRGDSRLNSMCPDTPYVDFQYLMNQFRHK
jgi:tellurium resistance protein TerD